MIFQYVRRLRSCAIDGRSTFYSVDRVNFYFNRDVRIYDLINPVKINLKIDNHIVN